MSEAGTAMLTPHREGRGSGVEGGLHFDTLACPQEYPVLAVPGLLERKLWDYYTEPQLTPVTWF